jgi:TRAP-type C4-dicarboxylate transport system substrate-binding protein
MGFGKSLIRLSAIAAMCVAVGSAWAQDTMTLRGIAPYPEDNYLGQPLAIFGKILEEKSGGKLKVKFLGADEVVPPLEQFDAVRNGTVDIALGVASYYTGSIPEAISIQFDRDKTPEDLRKNGYIDLMKKLHLEKGNVVYVANASGRPGGAFRLYTAKKITSLDDLKGVRFRVSPVYTAIVEGIGAVPVALPPADTYSALERKVVEGLGWTYAGTLDYGFPEVAKYVIDHPFYTIVSNILMNKAVYDGLSDEMKAAVEAAAIEFESKVTEHYDSYVAAEDDKLRAAGAEFIKLSDADVEKYLSAAYDGGWKAFLEKNPEYGPQIEKMLR